MVRTMLNRLLTRFTLVCCWSCALAQADTVQLKEKAAITGKILAEKRDLIVVDVGYTVLTVPRNQIGKIIRDETKSAPASKADPNASSSSVTTSSTPATTTSTPVAASEPKGGLFKTGAATLGERSVRELVNQLGEGVVQVRTPGGLGSGFFINDEGFLITNFHVIENETQISIEVYHQKGGQLERKSYRQVRIAALNKFADLALLKIEDAGAPKFSTVLLAESDSLAVGERVFAIGSPLGLERTVTEGIISTKTRLIQGDLYLQTTAQINPGNSGGPLFNLRGEVVGVTNMKITFGEGLGFAIPVETVKFFLSHRDAFAYDNDNPSNAFRYLEPPSRTSKRAEAR